MSKIISYGDESRKKIYEWIEQVADAVKVTLWPKGRNVIIERSFGWPNVTNDGVTVAKEIELEDKFENIGANLVKEAANKTNDSAGDGTSTTVMLVNAITKEWLKYIKSGVNPFTLWKGLHKAVDEIVAELNNKSKKINTPEEIKQVATISAQDENVGTLISEIMDEVGKDGVITVEEWKSIGLEKDVVKWMQFDQGYASPYFVTDSNRMEAIVENANILITDKKISNIKEILPVMEQLASTGDKNMVIIADDIDGEALATLVLNKLRWVLNVIAIKAPWFGDRKKEIMQDIAIVTGATVITEDLWLKLDTATVDLLGKVDKIIATKDTTTVVWWKWKQSDIDDRVNMIRNQIEASSSDYDKEKMIERVARMAGWVAVIKVGAATEMEMKNKKYKIEDALNATRAAVEEGILPGGGTALLKLQKTIENIDIKDDDEKIWLDIIKVAIEYPATLIAQNAGFKGDLVVEKVKENKDFNFGFDAKNGEYKDLVKAGIIDPSKVVRVALENAVSSAAMVLTTDAVIVDKPEKEAPAMPDMWGMWWMWGMGMPGMM